MPVGFFRQCAPREDAGKLSDFRAHPRGGRSAETRGNGESSRKRRAAGRSVPSSDERPTSRRGSSRGRSRRLVRDASSSSPTRTSYFSLCSLVSAFSTFWKVRSKTSMPSSIFFIVRSISNWSLRRSAISTEVSPRRSPSPRRAPLRGPIRSPQVCREPRRLEPQNQSAFYVYYRSVRTLKRDSAARV